MCNLDPKLAERLAYVKPHPDARTVRFQGHCIEEGTLRNSRVAICPACIRDDGYARAVWDLRIVRACPRHKLMLLNQCPGCGKPISWLRPQVATCRCGEDLASAMSDPAPAEHLALSAAVECTLAGNTQPWLQYVGSPNALVEQIARMSLEELHRVLRGLERLAGDLPVVKHPETITTASAAALLDWPEGFHRSLDAAVSRRDGVDARDMADGTGIKRVLCVRRLFRRLARHFDHADRDCLAQQVPRREG